MLQTLNLSLLFLVETDTFSKWRRNVKPEYEVNTDSNEQDGQNGGRCVTQRTHYNRFTTKSMKSSICQPASSRNQVGRNLEDNENPRIPTKTESK